MALRTSRRGAAALAALAVFVTLAVAGLGTDGGTPSASAQARTVTVSPGGPLTAGQAYTVSWSGFSPGSAVYIHQCDVNATSWRQCSEVTRLEAVTRADGTGSATTQAWTGDLPKVPNLAGVNDPITCVGGSCAVFVSECGFDLNPALTAKRALSLSASGTNPPVPTTAAPTTSSTAPPPTVQPVGPTISGTGDSDSQLAVRAWQFAALEFDQPRLVDVTTKNSPSAVKAYTDGITDFAVTNIPATAEQEQAIKDNGRGVAYVPVALNALAMPYQWRINGVQVTDLRIAPPNVAEIYRGNLTGWNSPLITADNRGCRYSSTAVGTTYPVPAFRGDQSGSNLAWSSWLATRAQPQWQPVLDVTGGVSTVIGIDDSKIYARTGADDLARFVFEGLPDNSSPEGSRANDPRAGRHAFVDRSFSVEYGLRNAALQNKAGQYVLPTNDAILEAMKAATVRPDGVVVPNYDDPNPAAYPLPMVTYVMVPTVLTEDFPADEAVILKEWLTWVIGPEGQAAAAEQGFVPITPQLFASAEAAIAKIPTSAPTGSTTTTAPTNQENLGFDDGFDDGGFGFDDGGFGDSGFESGFSESFETGVEGAAEATAEGGSEGAGESEEGPAQRVLSALVDAASAIVSLPTLLAAGLALVAVGPLLRMNKKVEVSEGADAPGAGTDG